MPTTRRGRWNVIVADLPLCACMPQHDRNKAASTVVVFFIINLLFFLYSDLYLLILTFIFYSQQITYQIYSPLLYIVRTLNLTSSNHYIQAPNLALGRGAVK